MSGPTWVSASTSTLLGVGEYIACAGFTPTGICLMLTSPDFVLSPHEMAREIALPQDYCARDGHDFNPHRERQVWTNHQLRGLINELHARGVTATAFTTSGSATTRRPGRSSRGAGGRLP